jgi:hypothetical protein
MKTKLLALGFSLAFLTGNAVYGGLGEDPKGPIHTLQPFVVYPHVVKLLNDQKLEPIDYKEIIRIDVENIYEETRRSQIPTMIAFDLKAIYDVKLFAATNI